MRKDPGTYIITIWDEVGSKHTTIKGNCLTESDEIAENYLKDYPDYSYTVYLVVRNSKIRTNKYQ